MRCAIPTGRRAASSPSISPSPPSDGGEGWGEEVRFYCFPLSSVLSPLVPRGERMESLMQPCPAASLIHFRFDRGRTGCHCSASISGNAMAELRGNLLVAQSGGPTAVINASVAGVIQEAGRHEVIEEIYGGLNGILGILNEDLIDLNEEKAKAIEGLKYTPAAALGTCRYKLDFKKKPDRAARDMDRLFEVFQAHQIRYFFYAGGNDSQDTSHKIHEEAVKRAYELRVIGVPKTIDNDLPHTDHSPGYGPVIKYNATT